MSKNQIDGPPKLSQTELGNWEGSMTLVDGREPSRGPESQLSDYYEQARQHRWLGGFRGATSLPLRYEWRMSDGRPKGFPSTRLESSRPTTRPSPIRDWQDDNFERREQYSGGIGISIRQRPKIPRGLGNEDEGWATKTRARPRDQYGPEARCVTVKQRHN